MGRWARMMAGMYKRFGSDGKTVLAYIARNENGTWDFAVMPLGKDFYTSHGRNCRPLAEAKLMAETRYRRLVKDIREGRVPAC